MKHFIVLSLVLVLTICVESEKDFQEIELEEEMYQISYTYKTLFTNENGSIYFKEDKLAFECNEELLLTDISFEFKTVMSVKQLAIKNCKLPAIQLVDYLRTINVNEDTIETLYISLGYKEQLLPANYTLGLNLRTFGIKAQDTPKFFENNPDFLNPMLNLTTLMVWGYIKVPPMPEPVHLRVLSLRGFAVIPNWKDYCSRLEVLSINYLLKQQIPNDWTESCSRLTALRLESLSPAIIQYLASSNISRALKNIRTLYLPLNDLESLPYEMLSGPENLNRIDLSGNYLTDNSFVDFPLLKNLTYLNLSTNQLTGWFLFDIVKQMPAIRELDLSYNNFFNLFCNYESRMISFAAQLSTLERLSFEGMEMNPSCFEKVHFPRLEYLNLMAAENSVIKKFKLQSLPKTNATRLLVNMHKRIVEKVVLDEREYKTLRDGNFSGFWGTDNYNRTKLTIQLSRIECDCENYWFARTLKEFPDLVSIEEVLCKDSGFNFFTEPLEHFDCQKYYNYGCVFRAFGEKSTGHTSYYSLQCTDRKKNLVLPDILEDENIISINVSDNTIENIHGTKWHKTAQLIDIRGNRLSRLNENDMELLLAFPERRVFLSRNLLICDCESQPMLDTLHNHKDQVIDFEQLICVDSNRTLSTVTSYEVCQIGAKVTSGIGGTLAAIMVVLSMILWRYRLQVKIYLYSRGWCLFCLSEEDVDADRPYDAFLSFSHGDEDYVMNELLPRLESEPDLYRVCVHFRDWDVGDWIPAQIMRSVRLSKRTIIVLSRQFVQSMWGTLEFRYAAASASQEHRPRMLVLVLDDVLSEELDTELQGYLSYNTYLRCDDPWFWEKLRYAMPRRKPPPVENPVLENVAENRSSPGFMTSPPAIEQPIIESCYNFQE